MAKHSLCITGLLFFTINMLSTPLASAQEEAVVLLEETTLSKSVTGKGYQGNGKMYQLKLDALSGLRQKMVDRIKLPVNGEELLFESKSQERRKGKTATWQGQTTGKEASVLLTAGEDHFFARVKHQGQVVVFRPDPQTGTMIAQIRDPALEMSTADDFLIAENQAPEYDAMEIQLPEAKVVKEKSQTTIDVMVLYTNGLADQYPGSQMVTRIQYLIDTANEAFSNSEINARYNLVHAEAVAYSDYTMIDTALNNLTYHQGVFSQVENLRNQYGADQVTLLRQFVDGNQGCGLAWVMSGDWFNNPYAVVHDGELPDGSGYYCTDSTFTHELGHNLGCAHDYSNSHSPGYNTDYSYGYQHPTGKFRTIMAYQRDCAYEGGCEEIPHFSNPNVTWEGDATGTGVADNARTINETSALLAALKASSTPDIALSFAEYDFGRVELEENVSSVGLYVSNVGEGPLELQQLSGLFTPFSLGTDNCSNTTLDAGDHCLVYLDLASEVPGVFTQLLYIPSNDADEPELVVPLQADLYSSAPYIHLSKSNITFRSSATTDGQEASLIISNLGQQTLELGMVEKLGDISGIFSLVSDGCSGKSLAFNQQCNITIKYDPGNAKGAKTDVVDGSRLAMDCNDPLKEKVLVKLSVASSFPWNLFMPTILSAANRK